MKQQIFQSVDPNKKFISGTGSFSGYYGVAGFEGSKLTSLYLGKGNEIVQDGYSLISKTPDGSANLTLEGKTISVSCNQETEVGLPMSKVKKAILQIGLVQQELKFSQNEKIVLLTVPVIENGVILLE